MKSSPRFPASFTLTEVLTATAVLSVLFTVMFGILQQTSQGWQAANRRVEASQAVRLAFEQICQDLEHCYPVRATNVALPRMGSSGTNLATNNTSNYAFGFVHANNPSTPTWMAQSISQPNDYIFMVTSYAPSVQMGSGDLAEVGYVPVFVNRTSGGSPGYANVRVGRYALLRSLPLTIPNAAGNAPLILTPLVDFYANAASWESTPGIAQDFNTTNFFPVVDNCIGFDVSFWYRRNGTGPLTNSPTWGRPVVGSTNWPGSPGDALPGLPAAAQVTLCVVDERTAERIYRLNSNGLTAAQISNVIASVTNPAALAQIPDSPRGMRNVLRQGVISFQRTVYFKNATNY